MKNEGKVDGWQEREIEREEGERAYVRATNAG
jgi:hypothetical protein